MSTLSVPTYVGPQDRVSPTPSTERHPPADRPVLTLLQIDWASELDPAELVQLLRQESGSFAALVVCRGRLCGADRAGETYHFASLNRVVGRRAWRAFFDAAAAHYKQTFDLSAAVAVGLAAAEPK